MESNVDTTITANETIITISVPAQDPALFNRATNQVKIATALVIDSPAMFNAAGEDLIGVKTLLKKLEDQRDGEVRPLNSKVKEINDQYCAPKKWLQQAEQILKSKMLTYQNEQDLIAAEKQRAADAAARAERDRLAEIARQQQAEADRQARDAAEALAAQERAVRDREAAEAASRKAIDDAAAAAAAGDEAAVKLAAEAQAKAERDRQQAEADQTAAHQAQTAAATRAAEAQESAATTHMTMEVMQAPVIASAARKVSGISTSKTWKARITDLPALLTYIAAHPECHDWVDIKMTPLNGMAKALKKNMVIAGVEAFEESSMSARAA